MLKKLLGGLVGLTSGSLLFALESGDMIKFKTPYSTEQGRFVGFYDLNGNPIETINFKAQNPWGPERAYEVPINKINGIIIDQDHSTDIILLNEKRKLGSIENLEKILIKIEGDIGIIKMVMSRKGSPDRVIAFIKDGDVGELDIVPKIKLNQLEEVLNKDGAAVVFFYSGSEKLQLYAIEKYEIQTGFLSMMNFYKIDIDENSEAIKKFGLTKGRIVSTHGTETPWSYGGTFILFEGQQEVARLCGFNIGEGYLLYDYDGILEDFGVRSIKGKKVFFFEKLNELSDRYYKEK